MIRLHFTHREMSWYRYDRDTLKQYGLDFSFEKYFQIPFFPPVNTGLQRY
jgi:hypothetical protein